MSFLFHVVWLLGQLYGTPSAHSAEILTYEAPRPRENREEYEILEEGDVLAHVLVAALKLSHAADLYKLSFGDRIALWAAKQEARAARVAAGAGLREGLSEEAKRALLGETLAELRRAEEMLGNLGEEVEHAQRAGDRILEARQRVELLHLQAALPAPVAPAGHPSHAELVRRRWALLQKVLRTGAFDLQSLGFRVFFGLGGTLLVADATLEIVFRLSGKSDFAPLFRRLAPGAAPRPVLTGELEDPESGPR